MLLINKANNFGFQLNTNSNRDCQARSITNSLCSKLVLSKTSHACNKKTLWSTIQRREWLIKTFSSQKRYLPKTKHLPLPPPEIYSKTQSLNRRRFNFQSVTHRFYKIKQMHAKSFYLNKINNLMENMLLHKLTSV